MGQHLPPSGKRVGLEGNTSSFAPVCVIDVRPEAIHVAATSVSTNNAATRPHFQVRITDIPVHALLDTGSHYNLIDEDFASKLSHNQVIMAPSNISLIGADQQNLSTGTTCTAPTSFHKNLQVDLKYLTVKNLQVPILIGSQFVNNFGLSINLKRGTATTPGGLLLPLHTQTTTLVAAAAQVTPHHTLKLSKPLTVAAWSEQSLQIPTDAPMGDYISSPVGMEESDDLLAQTALIQVRPSRLAGSSAGIVLSNVSDATLSLPRGTPVALISPVHGDDVIALPPVLQKLADLVPTAAVREASSSPTGSSSTLKRKFYNLADIDMKTTPPDIVPEYRKLVQEFHDVFSKHDMDLGRTDELPHVVKLHDPQDTVYVPPYRMPVNLLSVAHDYVDKLLQADVIRPSTSPFCSPLMLVRKAKADPKGPPTANFRVVHNYRMLNTKIKPCAYPLRSLHGLLDEVAQAKIFSVLDLSSGYMCQKLVDPHEATAFGVPGKGHYTYVRSPQGLSSSPAYFQRLLDFVIRGLPGVTVYLDDIIVVSTSHNEHLVRLKTLFTRLRKFALKLNPSKVTIAANEVNFLGFHISAKEGIRAGAIKTHAISEACPPSTIRGIRQFLGLTSFFRKTVKDFAKIASPLTKLTRKDNLYKKGPLPADALEAFRTLKKVLVSRPVLAPLNQQQPFFLTVDTSQVAHGAILSQPDPTTGLEHPVAYASKALSPAATKRSAFHREAQGILWALLHFRYAFSPRFITIRTDHAPLLKLNSDQAEFSDSTEEQILRFRPFKMVYCPGDKIPADYLSRPEQDPAQVGPDNVPPDPSTTKPEEPCAPVKLRRPQVGYPAPEEPTPPLGDSTVVPFTKTTLLQAQKEDVELKALFLSLAFDEQPDMQLLKSFVHQNAKHTFVDEQGLLRNKNCKGFWVPAALRRQLLVLAHDATGHRRSDTVHHFLKGHYFWTNMGADISNHVDSCTRCKNFKVQNRSHVSPMQPLHPALSFNQRIHVDCRTGLPPAEETGNTAVFTMVDAFSGLTLAAGIKSPTGEEICRVFLDKWICHYSAPEECVSDGGPEACSQVFKTLTQTFHTRHILTSPHRGPSNGAAERSFRAMNEFLMRLYCPQSSANPALWEKCLPPFLLVTNSTRSQPRGFSPVFLAHGRVPRLPFQQLQSTIGHYGDSDLAASLRHFATSAKHALENQQRRFEENAKLQSKRVHELPFREGQLCHIAKKGNYGSKLSPKAAGPFLILKTEQNYAWLRHPLRTSASPSKHHLDNLIPVSWRREIFQGADPSPVSKGRRSLEHDRGPQLLEVEQDIELQSQAVPIPPPPPPPPLSPRLGRAPPHGTCRNRRSHSLGHSQEGTHRPQPVPRSPSSTGLPTPRQSRAAPQPRHESTPVRPRSLRPHPAQHIPFDAQRIRNASLDRAQAAQHEEGSALAGESEYATADEVSDTERDPNNSPDEDAMEQ